MKPIYPWSAVVGQDALKRALLLCAIDPSIGGVLVQGPRGVAKTTLARALSQLVAGRFIELPLGATEERVTGSLDLESALRDGRVDFSPGLLARAHDGVLYVDEINLLPDALVDLMLDAAATGQNTVERDGVSHVHPARFVLIGTMNPEEGELRPQLTDRFGLSVDAEAEIPPAERAQIVARRLAFDSHPTAFTESFRSEQHELVERCQRARELASRIALNGPALERVGELCYAARVEGVRADLAMLRAARAHAAWHERTSISIDDVYAVAELALAHRRRRAPEPPKAGSRGGGGGGGERAASGGGSSPGSRASSSSGGAGRKETEADSRRDSTAASDPTSGPRDADDASTGGALAPVPVRAAAAPTLPLWLTTARSGRSEPRRRGLAQRNATRGRRGPQGSAIDGSVDWFATLSRCPRPQLSDLQYRSRRAPHMQLWVLALDCSASMLRSGALAAAKGVAHAFERHAVRTGAQLALISFSGSSAQLQATTSAGRATRERALEALGGGGGTPLRAALHEAVTVCLGRRFRSREVTKRIVLLTDGRTREAEHESIRFAIDENIELLVIDCERGPVRLGRAATLAAQLGGRSLHVDSL